MKRAQVRRRSLSLLVLGAVLAVGCSDGQPTAQSHSGDVTTQGSPSPQATFYVSNQSEFDYALANSSGYPYDKIVITQPISSWPYYTLPSADALDGQDVEASSGVTISVAPYSVHQDLHLKNVGLVWNGDVTTYITIVNGEFYASGLSRYLYPGRVITEGNVNIAKTYSLWLDVSAGSTVDIDSCSFVGAQDMCDVGPTVVDENGTLNVRSWHFGSMHGGYDPLIVSTDVVAMSNCMWGYLRIYVADAEATVGKVYYGDSDCSQYEQSTTVIGNYHYAQIRIDYFADGDFYWRADVKYCSNSDWAEDVTSCSRKKKSVTAGDCEEPVWWPY